MSLKDPATRRLRIILDALANHAGAECCALFMPRKPGVGLVAHNREVDQKALDAVLSAWVRHRAELDRGTLVPFGHGLVWPLFDGPKLAALLYLDVAPPGFPEDDEARNYVLEIVARLRHVSPPTVVNNYLALGLSLIDARQEAERDQIAMALQVSHGKVRAAARLLGVTRETVYQRASKYGIDLDAFKRTD